MVQDVVTLLSPRRQRELPFKKDRPFKKWLRGFLANNPEFVMKGLVEADKDRVRYLILDTLAIHIARLKAAKSRYGIHHPTQVANLDEKGISFKAKGRRCKRIILGVKGENL